MTGESGCNCCRRQRLFFALSHSHSFCGPTSRLYNVQRSLFPWG